MKVFLCPIPTCTLGEITWNRDRCSSHLLRQSIALLRREASSHLIHSFSQLHREFPSIEPLVWLTPLHFLLPTSHLLLTLSQNPLKNVPDAALPLWQFQAEATAKLRGIQP